MMPYTARKNNLVVIELVEEQQWRKKLGRNYVSEIGADSLEGQPYGQHDSLGFRHRIFPMSFTKKFLERPHSPATSTWQSEHCE